MISTESRRWWLLVLVVIATSSVFMIFAPIGWWFGCLEGRVHRRSHRVALLKGRVTVFTVFFSLAALYVAWAQFRTGGWIPAKDGIVAAVAGIGLQTVWAIAELGILFGGLKVGLFHENLDRDYTRELERTWVRLLQPGRWIALWLILPQIFKMNQENKRVL
ncbi:MAG: hypothetical protein AAGA55_10135 [Planctomycetota bacterium]